MDDKYVNQFERAKKIAIFVSKIMKTHQNKCRVKYSY